MTSVNGINVMPTNISANIVHGTTSSGIGGGDAANKVAMIGQQNNSVGGGGGLPSQGLPSSQNSSSSPHNNSSSSSSNTSGQVLLKDVSSLVHLNVVAVPFGFTKLGTPVLFFPDDPANSGLFSGVPDSDLHILFKYFLAVVPR